MHSESDHQNCLKVTDSIYDMVGPECQTTTKERLDMLQKVQSIFSSMDSNSDGVISREEFMQYCHHTNRQV